MNNNNNLLKDILKTRKILKEKLKKKIILKDAFQNHIIKKIESNNKKNYIHSLCIR